jgi:hypothetical protein
MSLTKRPAQLGDNVIVESQCLSASPLDVTRGP